MFLLVDENGNVMKKRGIKELKELLVDEIKEACMCNRDDKEVLYGLLCDLGKVATNDEINYEEELKNFGWYVKDLMQIHRDLYDLREYLHGNTKFNSSNNEEIHKCMIISNMDNILNYIESELI